MNKTILKNILIYSGIPIIAAVLLFYHYGKIDSFKLLHYILLIVFGYIASISDIKSKSVPNRLILIMFGAWAVTMIPKLFLGIDSAVVVLKDSMLGFILGGGLFLLIYIISKKGMGGADVKFMAAAGLYIGSERILSAMLYGAVILALIGIILLVLKKIGPKDTLPFIPFIYIGILIATFYR